MLQVLLSDAPRVPRGGGRVGQPAELRVASARPPRASHAPRLAPAPTRDAGAAGQRPDGRATARAVGRATASAVGRALAPLPEAPNVPQGRVRRPLNTQKLN